MLKLENVYKTFFPGSPNEKKALQGVSFTTLFRSLRMVTSRR